MRHLRLSSSCTDIRRRSRRRERVDPCCLLPWCRIPPETLASVVLRALWHSNVPPKERSRGGHEDIVDPLHFLGFGIGWRSGWLFCLSLRDRLPHPSRLLHLSSAGARSRVRQQIPPQPVLFSTHAQETACSPSSCIWIGTLQSVESSLCSP